MNSRTALSTIIDVTDRVGRLLGKVGIQVGGTDVSVGNAVPVSLPATAATGAKQDTGNASLASILAAFLTRLLTDGGPWAFGDPVTPSDAARTLAGNLIDVGDIPNGPARGLRVITAGTVKYELLRSDGLTRYPVTETLAAGAVIPAAVYKVYLTGTSATLYAGF